MSRRDAAVIVRTTQAELFAVDVQGSEVVAADIEGAVAAVDGAATGDDDRRAAIDAVYAVTGVVAGDIGGRRAGIKRRIIVATTTATAGGQ